MVRQTNPIPVTYPTDAYIPTYLPGDRVSNLADLKKLIEMDSRLDLYLTRRRLDTSINLPTNTKPNDRAPNSGTLRIYVYNTTENHTRNDSDSLADPGKTTWTLRIEGKLLHESAEEKHPFSGFLEGIAIDFKKLKPLSRKRKHDSLLSLPLSLQQPDGNDADIAMGDEDTGENEEEDDDDESKKEIVDALEWNHDENNAVEFDGIDIKRQGKENLKSSITIQLKSVNSGKVQYSPNLARLIGMRTGSVKDAVYSIYKYILINNLFVTEQTKSQDNANDAENNNENNSNTSDADDDGDDDDEGGDASQDKAELGEVRLDSFLQKVLNTKATHVPLMNVVQSINTLVSPLPPIKLDYTIDVTKDTTYGATILDVDVSHILHQPQLQPQIPKDEQTDAEDAAKLREITKLALQLNSSAQKYQFLHELSLHPRETLTHYLWSSKQNELVLQGDQYFNEDAARTSDIYSNSNDDRALMDNISVLYSQGRL
ncbi:Rsc6p [Saccharomyces cerevisiae x Saccharomyces kudriavzevii VIN7]|uniref:Rsc6p n=1 Tax=Saccharomyces cerevisiae x Saccharomyces kudriavzevii (strain VIN7) TaxID=1095631 RepID=H0GRY1_SACCK|nr:Rsc6p [Saccharomyces cerevisiae x Saccharomyces kudriavzevii VIN7]